LICDSDVHPFSKSGTATQIEKMKKPPVKKNPGKKSEPGNVASSNLKRTSVKLPALGGSLIGIFLLTFLTCSPALRNGFIKTWDDDAYVISNKLLKDLSSKNLHEIFSFETEFSKLTNNYHPLTVLSLALNYQGSELSPASYHLTNIILHSLNALLAFLFIFMLANRKLVPAIIAGVWFGIHPMHVESVAWISERKDVLYGFFFLGGLISYLYYLRDQKFWQISLTFLLFLLSVLSKAMAVPFPFILLIIDYYKKRPFSWKMILEKVPFLVTALLFGLLSVHLQAKSAINAFETFTFYQRIMHASYGFIEYLIRFLLPFHLSAFYPYPLITDKGVLPMIFRLAPYICLLIAGISIWLFSCKGQLARVFVFGILFYFLMLALVLQFFSVGKAITADRYTYIPYIGLTFILGMLVDHLISGTGKTKLAGYFLFGIIGIISLVFTVSTYERVKIWKDDISLWSNSLDLYSDVRMNFIYEKRAGVYLEDKNFDLALNDYLTILKNDPANDNACESIGRIYGQHLNNLDKAFEYLEMGYRINPGSPFILKSLGVAYGIKGQIDKSLEYLLKAYAIDPEDAILLRNIASSYHYLGNPGKAEEFSRLAEISDHRKQNGPESQINN
jgi:protein O-mannosyl-transferase